MMISEIFAMGGNCDGGHFDGRFGHGFCDRGCFDHDRFDRHFRHFRRSGFRHRSDDDDGFLGLGIRL